MGFPLKNNYSLFQAIRRESALNPAVRAPKALAQFDLFAFVLHDPNEHHEFHEALAEDFDGLDYISGQKLLFFCLTDPPATWLKMAEKRSYMKLKWGEDEANVLHQPEAAIRTRDSSLTTHTLARFLEIPSDELPCIFVTTDFYSAQGIYVQTHQDLLEEQLRTLGQIAERHGIDSQQDIYTRILDELPRHDISPTPHTVNWASDPSMNNLGSVIAEAMSLLIPSSSDTGLLRPNPYHACRTERNSEEICNAVEAGLRWRIAEASQPCRVGSDQSEKGSLESCLEKLALVIQSLSLLHNTNFPLGDDVFYSISGAEPTVLEEGVFVNSSLLDSQSTKMLNTGNSVLSFLRTQPSEIGWDYSPAVMMFAKVFEREMNLSLVQYMRKISGVSMPQYFNRFQPEQQAIWQEPRTEVELDFNRAGNNGALLLPALGQSVKWFEAYLGPHEAMLPLSESAKTAIGQGRKSKWKKLARIRNDASHTELASLEMVESVCRIFGEFNEGELFDDLCKLREQMSENPLHLGQ